MRARRRLMCIRLTDIEKEAQLITSDGDSHACRRLTEQ